MVGVAQLVRAPGCGPGGRGFKSLHSPQTKKLIDWMSQYKAPVAQLDRASDFESAGRRFESCGRAIKNTIYCIAANKKVYSSEETKHTGG